MTEKQVRKIIQYSAAGFILQAVIAVLLYMMQKRFDSWSANHVTFTVLAGLAVWLFTIVRLSFNVTASDLGKTSDVSAADITPHTNGKKKNRWFTSFISRYAPVTLELVFAGVLLMSTASWVAMKSDADVMKAVVTMEELLTYAFLEFGLVIISVFLFALSNNRTLSILKTPSRYFSVSVYAAGLLMIQALFGHFGHHAFRGVFSLSIPLLNTILAAEVGLSMVMRFFRPYTSEDGSFDSRLLEMLLHPMKVRGIISETMRDLLGYDISTTTFYLYLKRSLPPAVIFLSLTTIFLSSILILEPGYQAAVLKFGRNAGIVSQSGLHLTLPWPFSTIRTIDTDRVRRIHSGSHRPDSTGMAFLKEDVPLLWTNTHGVRNDELLITASPRYIIGDTRESSDWTDLTENKTPAVSLVGANVVVEYHISDAEKFVFSYQDPQRLVFLISEKMVSLEILKYEIDELFSAGRLHLASSLVNKIQKECDRFGLGVKILHVNINSVHPPLEVAPIFEENVSARQERETIISAAQQHVIRNQVETAGSSRHFKRLIELIDREEKGDRMVRPVLDSLLLTCGGEVSRVLWGAYGYRWSRENNEGGKAERFRAKVSGARERIIDVYMTDQYLSTLESVLADRKKVVFTRNVRDLIVTSGVSPGQFLKSP